MNQILSQIEKVNTDSKQTYGQLSFDQINWKPNPKSWSIGQCFEHLIVTNNLYFPNIQKVIDGTHSNNYFSKIPFSTNLIAALMKKALNPDQKRKMKTFNVFEPSRSDVSPTIINDFVENNQKLIEMIVACKDLELHKIKIAEPLSPALNLRLDDAFEILLIHEKRHFKQAERIMKAEGFPK